MYGDNLAGVGPAVGVEDLTESALCGQRLGGRNEIHVFELVQAHTMLACDGATGVHADAHDFPHRAGYAGRLVGVVGSIRDVRVQIAVTGVKHIAHREAIAHCYLMDASQHITQPRARYDRVLHREVQ